MASKHMIVIRQIFYALIIRPILILLLGLNVRHLERLEGKGPHLIAANHNSHLDVFVLMSLFKLSVIPNVKPVCARDYFCRTPFMTWLTMNVFGALPIDRKKEGDSDPLAPVMQALDEGYVVVLFPEGSRGEPEIRQPLKYGIAKIVETKPDVTVTPVFMHGLGKSLPRGEGLLVPFVCEINIGEKLSWNGEKSRFISALENSFSVLEQEIAPKLWE